MSVDEIKKYLQSEEISSPSGIHEWGKLVFAAQKGPLLMISKQKIF